MIKYLPMFDLDEFIIKSFIAKNKSLIVPLSN